MGTLMDRMRGISMVEGGEEVIIGGEIGKGNRVGKFDLLGNEVCSGYQSVACSIERV